MDEDESKKELRRKILAIHADPNLSPSEKAKQVQLLMTEQWRKAHPMPEETQPVPSNEPLDETPTYFNAKKQILGCAHYQRKCKLRAACCGKLVTCRLCHDETETSHKIDRYATKEMFCMICKHLQPVAQTCERCNNQMARYFCSICKFFDDDPKKTIYHCDKCGLCRIGVLGVDVFHCDECAVCLPMANKEHKHIQNRLHADCPICYTYMFTSVKGIQHLKCGHSMHFSCFKKYIRSHSYTCPLCSKSMLDMSDVWAELDLLFAEQRMPEEYKDTTVTALCNDCEKKFTAPFHFLGHKCIHCSSYNTKVLNVHNMPDLSSDNR